ncbi:MAG: Lsm family RNA-binding protein [Thaumarchaeota archaeon]|nr:Lsm family RNA-binding protein [Nitrososphaerota archaeon]
MGRIKVTPAGVAEGSGPAADTVKAIFEEFTRGQSQEEGRNPTSPQKGGRARNPFRCQHCGLRLTSGRVYRRTIGGSVMLFCCRQCADHEEAEVVTTSAK